MRTFETGATRSSDTDKLDYEGFLSPQVLHQFARYMNMHRVQSDGNIRNSDNWQRGIPKDAYMKSGFRHFMEWWTAHRGMNNEPTREKKVELVAGMCGVIFNAMGYLHEWLKENDEVRFDKDEPTREVAERGLNSEYQTNPKNPSIMDLERQKY